MCRLEWGGGSPLGPLFLTKLYYKPESATDASPVGDVFTQLRRMFRSSTLEFGADSVSQNTQVANALKGWPCSHMPSYHDTVEMFMSALHTSKAHIKQNSADHTAALCIMLFLAFSKSATTVSKSSPRSNLPACWCSIGIYSVARSMRNSNQNHHAALGVPMWG